MINELFGWTWVVFGMIFGGLLGLGFNKKDWLGGYASWPRRMMRLSHVSFVALGALNVLAAQSLTASSLPEIWVRAAGLCLMAGSFMMPISCLLAIVHDRTLILFTPPVSALLFGLTAVWIAVLTGGVA